MYWGLHRRSRDSGEFRFLRESGKRQSRRDFRADSGWQETQASFGDYRRAARTEPERSGGDQPAVRDSEFAVHRCLPAERWLQGAGEGVEADDARNDHRRNEKNELARARRGGLPSRTEMELRS